MVILENVINFNLINIYFFRGFQLKVNNMISKFMYVLYFEMVDDIKDVLVYLECF